MVKVNGGPVGPDGVGGSYHNTDSDDRAALWQSLGATQGLLSGGVLSGVAGSLALSMAAFRASVAERDAAGNLLARGYHAWSDDAVTVLFDPPAAQARNDAVVVAVADTSAGSGAFGTGVSEAGPQVVVVTGVAGVTTPRADADIQAWVGAGGWFRLADVPINPGDTQVNMATVSLAAGSSAAPAHCRIKQTATQSIPNAASAPAIFGTVVESNRGGFVPTSTSITIPAAGAYEVVAQFQWDGTANSGRRVLALNKNGTPIAGDTIAAFVASGVSDFTGCVYVGQFAAGDVLTVQVYQDNGSAVSSQNPDVCYLDVRARSQR